MDAESVSQVSGVGPTFFARNGGGDYYFTDGEMAVTKLSQDCKATQKPAAPSSVSAQIGLKNRLFALFAALWRRL